MLTCPDSSSTLLGQDAICRDEVFDKRRIDRPSGCRGLGGSGMPCDPWNEYQKHGRARHQTDTTDHVILPFAADEERTQS